MKTEVEQHRIIQVLICNLKKMHFASVFQYYARFSLFYFILALSHCYINQQYEYIEFLFLMAENSFFCCCLTARFARLQNN